MASAVFLDTAGLVALLNQDDQYHITARELFRSFGDQGIRVVTTSFILAEVGNVLARSELRDEVVRLIQSLHDHPRSKVVYVDSELMAKAIGLYRSRRDKDWGLVDCTSFALMEALGIGEAFTIDHHFEQAGFQSLIR